jgi:hypothetical protein
MVPGEAIIEVRKSQKETDYFFDLKKIIISLTKIENFEFKYFN